MRLLKVLVWAPLAVLAVGVVGFVLAWAAAVTTGPWLVLVAGPPSSHSYFHKYLGAITDAQSVTVVLMILLVLGGAFRHLRERKQLLWILFAAFLLQMLVAFAAQDIWQAHDTQYPAVCFSVSRAQQKTPSAVMLSSDAKLTVADAVYFVVGNFTTAGTGSIAPESETCRRLVTHQTVLGAIVLLIGIAGLVSTLRDRT